MIKLYRPTGRKLPVDCIETGTNTWKEWIMKMRTVIVCCVSAWESQPWLANDDTTKQS